MRLRQAASLTIILLAGIYTKILLTITKGCFLADITSIVHLLVLILLIALIVILVTGRLQIPYTLGLVVVGLAISLLGLFPGIRLI